MTDSQNLVHREVGVDQGDILQLVYSLRHQLSFNHGKHVGRQVEALHRAVSSNQTEQLLDLDNCKSSVDQEAESLWVPNSELEPEPPLHLVLPPPRH